jgi:preprotein translocase subunit SecG
MVAVLINYVVPVIHVVACLFLIVVVLLQTGKGADMGAVFGGGSQTLFGSGGAGNFLTRLTTGTAIAFMITSLILTYGATRTPTSRLLNQLPAAEAPAPANEPTADAGAPAPEAAAPAGEEQATPPAEQVPPAAAEVPPTPAPEGEAAPAPAQ